MRGLASRVRELKPSPTLLITAKAKELRAKGVDVIGFGAGEPDLDTPEFIKEACVRALKEGKTKYAPSAGLPELREAIAEKLEVENGLNYDPSEVVVCAGAKMALFLTFMALVEEGDEVLIPSPYWVTYPEQVRLFGGRPVEVPTYPEDGFRLRAEEVKKRITPRTKLLVLNYPNNPTGALYDESELKKIAELCLERGIFVVSDECYEKFVYEGSFKSFASLLPELKEITFTVNAFSKSFSMTGWRVGWVACPRPYAEVIASLNSQSVSNVTTFAQYGALEALKNPEGRRFTEKLRELFKKRREIALRELSKIEKIKLTPPAGAFYLFPDARYYAEKLGGDLKLAELLLDRGKVAVVPGSAFGAEGFFRLSYALSEDKLTEGIRRIAEVLSGL
ncbi:MAG: pyridoxal phosphate-dependent aminotransferase [Aquificae bacterium]|nr:pyridoxal phosphate-dependent aminotransferase [Aquificota bacterium]